MRTFILCIVIASYFVTPYPYIGKTTSNIYAVYRRYNSWLFYCTFFVWGIARYSLRSSVIIIIKAEL